jgi:heme oxygenase (biliverdin-IX-beta and delta-forming)
MHPASGPQMLSLRRATQDAHEGIDADIRRGDWLGSPSSYAAFLERNLRFHRIVEAAVAPVALRLEGLGYDGRRRSPLLEDDLGALMRAGVFPGAAESPSVRVPPLRISGPGAAFGCLYVIEGAMLGGTVLARWIESRLGYNRSFGASSFAARRGTTMKRWRAFGALVEARAASVSSDRALMLTAAQSTFAVHRAVVVNRSVTAEALTA